MKYKYNNEWKEMNVKVSDTLPIGSIVEYDGDTVPIGYEEVVDSGTGTGIKIYQNTDYQMGSNEQYTIALNTLAYKTNNQLVKDNADIVIGKNIHTILVCGRWTSWGAQGESRAIYIEKNNSTIAETFSKYNNTCETTVVIPVEEGDHIRMKGYQDKGSLITIVGAMPDTFLQVTVLN